MYISSSGASHGAGALILRADCMYTPHCGLRMNHEIVIEHGMISAIRPQQPAMGDRVVELGNAIILPGLVNAHTHLEYSALADIIDASQFFPWIRSLLKLRGHMSPEDYYISSLYGALQSLRSGTVALGDVTFSDASPRAIADVGLDATVYLEFTAMPDMVVPPFEEELDSRIKSLELDTRGSHIQLGVSAHSLYTVPLTALMPMMRVSSKRQLPFCIHMCESAEEMSLLVAHSGPYATLYDKRGITWSVYQPTPVQALSRRGFFNHEPTLIHGVYMDEADLGILQRHNIPIVHCPRSNAALNCGHADTDLWNRCQVDWAIGTDSAASAGDLDMWAELRSASLVNSLLTPDDLFEAATTSGYAAIKAPQAAGDFQSGHIANFCAVDLDRITPISDDPMYDVLAQGCAILNRMTMVRGDILYLNSEFMCPIVDISHTMQLWSELRKRLQHVMAEMEIR